MKQGLSLRVSQHLTLTPQLQQSIRLLQLSTLDLNQEVEQMLDENPFLERMQDEAPREEGDLDGADTPPVPDADTDEPAAMPVAIGAGVAETEAAEAAEATDKSDAFADDTDDGAGAEFGWDGDGSMDIESDDAQWDSDAPMRASSLGDADERADAAELARSQESLQDYLHRQALALRLSDEDRVALRFLIESLNDDGYLEESLPALASALAGDDNDQFDELVHHFQVALGLLQSLDPPGVGARSLGECLSIQIRALADPDEDETQARIRQTALAICKQPMTLLAKRDVKRLSILTRSDEPTVRAAIQFIVRLEPKPGRRFADVEHNVIVPDVIVTRVGRGATPQFRVQLNPDVMPRLRVHDIYAGALKQHKGEGSQVLAQRLQEARWFIRNIQQRFDTILRVSRAIVERQKSFFVHGELAMRPLVLREIADELGLHESTISRVTTAKYMETPFGTVELKYFFGSALCSETGGSASSTAVRALIKQFVAAENTKKPLSDSQLSRILKEQGIECARRTVAKYREALRIPVASLRKTI